MTGAYSMVFQSHRVLMLEDVEPYLDGGSLQRSAQVGVNIGPGICSLSKSHELGIPSPNEKLCDLGSK